MQHMHTYKAVTECIEAEKVLSRRRQSEYKCHRLTCLFVFQGFWLYILLFLFQKLNYSMMIVADGKCPEFLVAVSKQPHTLEVNGYLEVNLCRNVLWLPNLVETTTNQIEMTIL